MVLEPRGKGLPLVWPRSRPGPGMGQNEHQLEDQTRAKLLETARAMVLRGDTKFSVTVLCAEAGVERALFHTHFSGKTALMAALMQTQSVPAAAPMAPSQPAPDSKPVVGAAMSTAFQPVSKA